jgi:glycosyltransferase involved in cell wall biosynthesis
MKRLILGILNRTGFRREFYRGLIVLSQNSTLMKENPVFSYFNKSFAIDPAAKRRILLDVSVLTRSNARGGIQRVQRKFFNEAFNPIFGDLFTNPIYFDGAKYRHFNGSIQGSTELLVTSKEDDEVTITPRDIYVSLDLDYLFVITHQGIYSELQGHGVKIYHVVYDLLPLAFPRYFPDGIAELHKAWLLVVSRYDGLLCISKSVTVDLANWLTSQLIPHPKIASFKLGQDLLEDLHPDIKRVVRQPGIDLKFLMVGTLEPRKGYEEVISVFEQIWSQGKNFSLSIVGAPGWHTEKLVAKLREHSEFGRRLLWDKFTNDSKLIDLYKNSDFLIAASYGEGYGLPLVEASGFKLPIVARDIPVFREVSEGRAIFYDSTGGPDLLQTLLSLQEFGKFSTKESRNIETYSWAESFHSFVYLVRKLSTDDF